MSWLVPIKEFLSKAWAAIKKLPGWAVMAGLILAAVCVHLFKRMLVADRKAKIQHARFALEKRKGELVTKARSVHKEAGSEITKKFNAEIATLDAEEEELNKSIAVGPVGIASAWKDYLAGDKK